jgi:hypothetical protein
MNVTNILFNKESDSRLVSVTMANALKCSPWMVPDLAETTGTNMIPTYATAELQAAFSMNSPSALIPLGHLMTKVNNQPSLDKVNAYRAGCNQPNATALNSNTGIYCSNIYLNAIYRLRESSRILSNYSSPDPNVATNLFAYLALRTVTAYGPDGLNCTFFTYRGPLPVTLIKNMQGLVIGAFIPVPNAPIDDENPIGNDVAIIIIVFIVIGVVTIAIIIAGILAKAISATCSNRVFSI